MAGSILYCGDTDLNGAASYLAGLMTSWGWVFDYVPSNTAISEKMLKTPRSLIILSDYPASQFDPEYQQSVLRQIEQGCGLLMIGGWESFHGFGGDWDTALLSSVLPVAVSSTDDRLNFDQSAWLLPDRDSAITTGLPWRSRTPAIGGMNRVVAKPDATIVLSAHAFSVSASESREVLPNVSATFQFSPCDVLPALVTGQYGKGRSAAFMSDVAPHWVGGFVDWGLPRVIAQAANAPAIEVGGYYAQFWKQLIEWTKNN